jgi:hypothetical protein
MVMGDVTVDVPVNGRTFHFHLTRETVDLGPAAGRVDYFAFNGTAIRDKAGTNNAAITDAFRASWPLFEPPVNDDDVRMYLLAELHRALGHRDAIHGVYRSQYLHSDANRCESLSPSEVARLRGAVRAGPLGAMQSAFDGLFVGPLPSRTEALWFAQTFQEWINDGVPLCHPGREEDLNAWLKTATERFRACQRRSRKKYVERGTGDRMHRFLRYLAYESFTAFQRCCWAAWQFILPVLEHRYSLNGHSLDFMRSMHGIAESLDEADLTTTPGFLCGQALSLHPVGRWLLDRPEHLRAIGDWLADPLRTSALANPNRLLAHSAYQEVLIALLCCAREYALARNSSENQRSKRRRGHWLPNGPCQSGQATADGVDDLIVAEAIAMTLLPPSKRACPGCCSRRLHYTRLNPAVKHVRITYGCRCGCQVERLFTAAAVADAIDLYRNAA